MAIGKIGAAPVVGRDQGSASFEQLEKREKMQDAQAAPRNGKVDEVAKLYEKQFLREMVKAMRSTVSFGNDKPSMGENIYKEQLDEQYVDSWGEKGGVGLADLIYDQVMQRYFDSADGQKIKGQGGAIPLTDRDISKVSRMKTENPKSEQVPLRVEVKKSADGSPAKLQAPWDSSVVGRARMDGGKTALTLSHGPNLRSTLIFQGTPSAEAQPGARIEKGKTLGILSPDVDAFFWNLNKTGLSPDSGPGVATSVSQRPRDLDSL